ncbi:hypothetical protein FRZ00_33530 [Streptomyces mobaraensis]|uniref:Uncharacterized protein n=2 Tax=Streptomyces mobaraensis TaxID=35621 RepID=A0A5N5VXK0_STRMB|nr:hypothetical protein FRZ00_33530 [Streptomyces mobaraensis]
MDALRNWSAPGRRAELIAAAWKAGETNVSALAEAARISRPTVYADLRDQGIDPDHRPKGNTVTTTFAPISLEGLTGSAHGDGDVLREAVHRFRAEHPDDNKAGVQEMGRLMAIHETVGWYNTIRPKLQEEQAARAERDRTLHLVEIRWEALADPNSRGSFLHGHQAYVRAVHDARAAIDAWKEKAIPATEVPFAWDRSERNTAYEQIVAAGHPPVEALTIDPAAVAEQLRETLDQAHARRKEIVAETLGLAQSANQ